MEGAAIMRGEKTVKDITYDYKSDVGNYYGKPLVRPNALAKACGVCDYGDDVELKMPAETLKVALVMPRVANHARILSIDTSEAEKMPGVVKVITAKDIEGANQLMMFQFSPRTTAFDQVHKLLNDETIVNWGNVVAMVAADTKEHAKEAAAKVKVEIEQLPEYAVEGSFYSQREPHMSIEGDTVQAYIDEDGKICVHCKTMTLYFDRDDIAEATGLPVEDIRVIENPTGGSFGWAMNAGSYALAAIACKVLQKPVALSMDYAQFMAFSGKRSPSFINGRLACDADGKIVAGEFDAGLARAAMTNHAFGTAYRGYGAPQAYTAGEALIDMMAEKIGMDPFEFRYKNIARKGQTNINSVEFLQYPMEEMMDKMRPLYEKAVADAKAKDTPEIRRGVGLAWGGYNVGLGSDDFAAVAIELVGDGKFRKYDTWQDQGQGGDQGSLMCTLEALKPYFPGVTPDDIKLIQDDSKHCPNTGESAGSRSHFANGKASTLAAQNLANAMRKPDGTYRTYDEMVAEGIPTRYEGNWEARAEWEEFKLLDPNTGVGSPLCLHLCPVHV